MVSEIEERRKAKLVEDGGQSEPNMQRNEMGQAQQMVPINVEFAPKTRQNSFEPPKPLDQAALTPPEKGIKTV